MCNCPIIIVKNNPFNPGDRIVEQVPTGSKLIDWLKISFPNGFQRKTRITINGEFLPVDNYDKRLNEDDIVVLSIDVEGPAAILATAIVGAAVATGLVTDIATAFINSLIDIPDIPTSLQESAKTVSASSNYNLRLQNNTSRIGEVIPSQYGRFRVFADLAAQPYIRFENNIPVIRYLLSLGHGEFSISDLKLGETSILNDDSVTFTQFGPGQSMTQFNDNVVTSSTRNIKFLDAVSKMRDADFIDFDKTAKTVTFPNANVGLTTIFREDDVIRIISESTDWDGVFTIDTVTDTVITVTDSSAWSLSTGTDSATVARDSEAVLNTLFQFYDDFQTPPTEAYLNGGKYFFNSSYTGILNLYNPSQEVVKMEIDIEYPAGFYYDLSGTIVYPGNPINGYFIPVDDDGDLKTHYKNFKFRKTLTTIGGNAYQAQVNFRDWKNNEDLSALIFPTENDNDLVFLETVSGPVIPPSEISSIDYVNGIVTFTSSKGSAVFVKNVVKEYTDKDTQILRNRFGLTGLVIPQQTSQTRVSITVDLFSKETNDGMNIDYEINIDTNYKFVLYKFKEGLNGENFNSLVDGGQISRLKYIFPDIQNYPAITLAATEIVADKDFNFNIDNILNITATRKLPIWNGSSFDAPVATRSIVWAIADVWMSAYGGSRSFLNLDLDAFVALDATLSARGDFFDGIFDQAITVWEAISRIAASGRMSPILLAGDLLSLVRDEKKTTISTIFNKQNIVENSLEIRYSFKNSQEPDGIKIRYFDEDNGYKEAFVLSNENATKFELVDMFGVTQYDMAWRESQSLQAKLDLLKKNISFETELEGLILLKGDLVLLAYDLADWGNGGEVTGKLGLIVTTSEPLDFTGPGPFEIFFRALDGSVSGPHTGTQGANDKEFVLDSDVIGFNFITDRSSTERTYYAFGSQAESSQPKELIVKEVTPLGGNRVRVECLPYIEAIYDADIGTPPDKTISSISPDPIPPKVGGLNLSNVPSSGIIVATWNPEFNIDNYVVETSTDSENWVPEATPTINTVNISQTGLVYVRVASVIGSVTGEYISDNIQST